eukprot:COSAG06_NODE_62926_length_263_cov_1.579268_1_plen_79_part_01
MGCTLGTVGTRDEAFRRVRAGRAGLAWCGRAAIQVSQASDTHIARVTLVRVVTCTTQSIVVVARGGGVLIVVVEALRTH